MTLWARHLPCGCLCEPPVQRDAASAAARVRRARFFLSFIIAIAGAISCTLLSGGARADQTDARLDGLMQELAHLGASGAEEEAQQKAKNIQGIWAQSANPTVMILQDRIQQALDQGNLAIALRLANHITVLTPNLAHGWVLRARILYQQGACEDCIETLQRALKLEPRHFIAKWLLGSVMQAQGQLLQARQLYQEALVLYPGWQIAQMALQNLQDQPKKKSNPQKI